MKLVYTYDGQAYITPKCQLSGGIMTMDDYDFDDYDVFIEDCEDDELEDYR